MGGEDDDGDDDDSGTGEQRTPMRAILEDGADTTDGYLSKTCLKKHTIKLPALIRRPLSAQDYPGRRVQQTTLRNRRKARQRIQKQNDYKEGNPARPIVARTQREVKDKKFDCCLCFRAYPESKGLGKRGGMRERQQGGGLLPSDSRRRRALYRRGGQRERAGDFYVCYSLYGASNPRFFDFLLVAVSGAGL